jgi:hypothetical protein
MNSEQFDSTLPFGEPGLMRASAYRRFLEDKHVAEALPPGMSTRISSLSPSLRADLLRFEIEGRGSEAVEVLAACVRHTKRVTIQFQCGALVVPLSVFPREGLVHCPMDLDELIDLHLPGLRVLHVEPAKISAPDDDDDPERAPQGLRYHALTPLLWQMAMRGPRTELLPEIAGPAAYRVAPALDINRLPAPMVLLEMIHRLRGQSVTLRELAHWPGMNEERAMRLLNALYLQSGLIVSRSHPDAINERWFSGEKH